jgi:hypothetical protein
MLDPLKYRQNSAWVAEEQQIEKRRSLILWEVNLCNYRVMPLRKRKIVGS